jgi:hypothetical protein
MVFVMFFLSFSEHVLFIATNISAYIKFNLVTSTLFDLNDFFWLLKRVLDFFIFFFFNNNFKKVCLRHARLS